MQLVDFDLTPPGAPNPGMLFVDHRPAGRSGHLGHALVEYAPECLLAFYPNCSGKRNEGHNGFGWMEFKRSTDGGRTWSAPHRLDYSWKVFLDGLYTVSCEKAVACADGTIVLFATRNDSRGKYWGPWVEPQWLVSRDGGESWCVGGTFPFKGRIFDAAYRDGTIYVLEFCNDGQIMDEGTLPEHQYRLYVSKDAGKSFQERSVLPFDTTQKVYGTMDFLADGALAVYIYDKRDEAHAPYTVSRDGGRTWDAPQTAFLAKRIRNPQFRAFGGYYFLYGRSGQYTPPQNFVLYTSLDGLHWDDGLYLCERLPHVGNCYYANSVVVGHFDPAERQRLLIQASDAYEAHRTNVKHWFIENPRPYAG